MKTNKSDFGMSSSTTNATKKQHMFSNHGSLSASIIGKYGAYNTFISNKQEQRSNSRSPSNMRAPKKSDYNPLYKRHPKQDTNRSQTPNIWMIENINSFNEPIQPIKKSRNREEIRSKTRTSNSRAQKVSEISPSEVKKSSHKASKSPKWLKSSVKNSPKKKQSPKRSPSPLYNRKPSKSYLEQVAPAVESTILEERPRRLSHYQIQSVFENDQREEIERVKKANRELKDTVEKLMKNHLQEKKRMVENIEKLTQDYDKYAKFYKDNFERLRKFNEQKQQEPLPCQTWASYKSIGKNLHNILTDSLQDMIRKDISNIDKVEKAQGTIVDWLNEVKTLFQKDFTFRKTSISEIIKTPEPKAKQGDNDLGLLKTIEEALLLVRQNSSEPDRFIQQKSNVSTENNPNVMNTSPTNESFASLVKNKASPKALENGLKYKIEFVQADEWSDESYEEEEEESELDTNHNISQSRNITMTQESDSDDVVDHVLMSFSKMSKEKQAELNQDRISTRYQPQPNKSLEFIEENPFKESYSSNTHLKSILDSKNNVFNMPLQIVHNSDNYSQKVSSNKPNSESKSLTKPNQIEIAIWLYDFKPQKKDDLGFKAGERILIEFESDSKTSKQTAINSPSHNWWYGSIGTRKGWFPRNYVKIKKVEC